jgi:hypothetical protein
MVDHAEPSRAAGEQSPITPGPDPDSDHCAAVGKSSAQLPGAATRHPTKAAANPSIAAATVTAPH